MKTKRDIRSVTYMKANAAELLEQLNDERRPVVITQNGEARAVMIDPDSYDELRTAAGLVKLIAQGEESVRDGQVRAQDDVFADLEASLAGEG